MNDPDTARAGKDCACALAFAADSPTAQRCFSPGPAGFAAHIR